MLSMTLGALSITGNGFKRRGAGIPLNNASCMPFDGYFGEDVDTMEYLEALLQDTGSGIDIPAAVIVETVQAEGGINVASFDWLRRLAATCRDHEILLVIDDVQAGCGRTGPFFSFEPAGITPDIICLSKSLSGYGLPLAVTLIRPELDIWEPGEHNGTFRGNNPAFVTATAALDFWTSGDLSAEVKRKGAGVRDFLVGLTDDAEESLEVRGRGLIQGLDCGAPGLAQAVCQRAFENGVIAETSGPESTVVKIMPPLVVDDGTLEQGLEVVGQSFREVTEGSGATNVVPTREIAQDA